MGDIERSSSSTGSDESLLGRHVRFASSTGITCAVRLNDKAAEQRENWITDLSPSVTNLLSGGGTAIQEVEARALNVDLFELLRFRRIAESRLSVLTFTYAWNDATLFELNQIAAHKMVLPSSDSKNANYVLAKGVVGCISASSYRELLRPELRIRVIDPRVWGVLASLNANESVERIASSLGYPIEIVVSTILILEAFGYVESTREFRTPGEISGAGKFAPLEECWEPHDLAFHLSSRAGDAGHGYGATYRRPQPITDRESTAMLRIPLYRPDLSLIEENDLPLQKVIERRRSCREHDDIGMDVKQLGEFLYRTCRIQEIKVHDETEIVFKTYPSGGGLHALNIYPLITRCRGLDRGLYKYDDYRHQLIPIDADTIFYDKMLHFAKRASKATRDPHAVLIVSAEFQKVQWKYEKVAYSLLMKEVGGLYQTMYLAATAMGLAACALGGGECSSLSKAIDKPPLLEGQIGEFVLGNPLRKN